MKSGIQATLDALKHGRIWTRRVHRGAGFSGARRCGMAVVGAVLRRSAHAAAPWVAEVEAPHLYWGLAPGLSTWPCDDAIGLGFAQPRRVPDKRDVVVRSLSLPVRSCSVHKQVMPNALLLRFVRAHDRETGEARVVFDPHGTRPGRGVWVAACWQTVVDAVDRGILQHRLKATHRVAEWAPGMARPPSMAPYVRAAPGLRHPRVREDLPEHVVSRLCAQAAAIVVDEYARGMAVVGSREVVLAAAYRWGEAHGNRDGMGCEAAHAAAADAAHSAASDPAKGSQQPHKTLISVGTSPVPPSRRGKVARRAMAEARARRVDPSRQPLSLVVGFGVAHAEVVRLAAECEDAQADLSGTRIFVSHPPGDVEAEFSVEHLQGATNRLPQVSEARRAFDSLGVDGAAPKGGVFVGLRTGGKGDLRLYTALLRLNGMLLSRPNA